MKLDYGAPEEVATFGQLIITHEEACLTHGVSLIKGADAYQEGPHVSGCLLAEWIAWNWWRLRWEPSPQGPATNNWNFAHCLPSIGGGYIWPNVIIANDGFRCEITSTASQEPGSLSFHYLGLPAPGKLTFPASKFETECSAFVEQVLDLCNEAGLRDTDLGQIWQELQAERTDPELGSLRRLEALLGCDPGELPQTELAEHRQDAEILGMHAVDELAMEAGRNRQNGISRLSAREVVDQTASEGVEMRSSDAVAMSIPVPASWGHVPAWHLGIDLAADVRQQTGLGHDPIGNTRLAELAGMTADALTMPQSSAREWSVRRGRLPQGDHLPALTMPQSSAREWRPVSWVLHQNGNERIVFRTRRNESRRFDLARLIADRLFSLSPCSQEEAMLPATRTYSYRQKAQRAFAGEFLSPWLAIEERLNKDYSTEHQQQVAEEFGVSPMVIDVKIRSNVDFYNDVVETA